MTKRRTLDELRNEYEARKLAEEILLKCYLNMDYVEHTDPDKTAKLRASQMLFNSYVYLHRAEFCL